ncbi:rho guanine nucleotide exchange factor 7 [Galendromus occidentalis]|uniref:Rho guanine nucleotide exchange factor 7 n=1 Tax=Galendromus occidentalis TaxID=34638 RepID=A0AAJ7WHP6_9ACAR|nr:rho guanine nucleotide exchange factor 7 [Galendromus occidentalis]
MAPQRVKALYDYDGQHTDELTFRRGDIITLTQPALEGWFEGTLRGVTGWFPANYVMEVHGEADSTHQPITISNDNRQKVLSNIIETEASFVEDLDSFMNSTLQPVWRLFGEDYDLIHRNLEQILQVHRTLLSGLRGETNGEPSKVGKVFQAVFSRLKGAHSNYCALHPRIIKILMKHACVTNNNQPVNMLNVTLGLSAPFKRLEKFETLLEELTRHTPENHPDRGECQRSCNLFRELAQEMNAVRKQKDIETEILNANIKNWEGPPINTLGDVRVTCPVKGQWNSGSKDFYLVAFDSVIVLVSLLDSNEFRMDYRFPLDRTTISSVEKSQTLEMQFLSVKLLVSFHSSDDFEKIRNRVDVYSTVQKRSSTKSNDSSVILRSNGSRPVTPDSRFDSSKHSWNSSRISRPTSPAPPPPTAPKTCLQPFGSATLPPARMSLTISRIRGVLPHRRVKISLQKEAAPGLKRGSSARKNKKDLPTPILFEESLTNPSHYERDLQILKVVESFANLSKKPTIPLGGVSSNSAIGLTSLPSVRVSTLTSHSGAPGMEIDVLGNLIGRPKSISPISPNPISDQGALRVLQSDVSILKEQMAKLQADLQEERKHRKALQEQLNSLSPGNR